MEWQDYEQLVRRIYEQLGQERGVTVECSGHTCRVVGRSNVAHQIDVLTTFSDGVHTYRTAIECKHLNTKVDKTIVMQVAAIAEDAGLAKAVIVTTVGFTEDAITYARTAHVELVTLRPPTEEDWHGRIRNISAHVHVMIPSLTKAIFGGPIGRPETMSTEPRDCNLRYSDGREEPVMRVLGAFLDRMRMDASKDVHCETIPFDPPATLMDAAHSVPVDKLYMEGIFTGPSQEVKITGEDHVAYIMQDVFGNGRFVIDKEGRATERR